MKRFLRVSLIILVASFVLAGGLIAGYQLGWHDQDVRYKNQRNREEMAKRAKVKATFVPVADRFAERRDLSEQYTEEPLMKSRRLFEAEHNPRSATDPEPQLSADIQLAVAKYKNANDPKMKEQTVETLNKLATQQFEAYQKQREEELKALEDKVQKLRELHGRREKEKQEIVTERVRALLRNADGLGWGEENAPIAAPPFSVGNYMASPNEFGTIQAEVATPTVAPFPIHRETTRSRGLEEEEFLPDSGPAKSPNKTVKIFSLQHAKANDPAVILAGLFQPTKIGIAADERTNSILVSGDQSDLDTIEAVVKRLDQESKAPKADALPPIDPRYLDK